ncbi:hypothetical protein SDC9_52153 [bioreactor metagenome]|uniref:Uncharacterized protein n=1 Tax=bioreactor metagenome TaxID=1076179 RepID=A0A644WQW8_9ZZZZ
MGPDDGRRLGRYFPEIGEGVSFLDDLPPAGAEGVLVKRPFFHARDEALPDAGAVLPGREIVYGPVPAVECAGHAHFLGVGSPDGKVCSPLPAVFRDVGAEFFVEAAMVPLPEEIRVHLSEKRKIILRFFCSGHGSLLPQVVHQSESYCTL